MPPKASKTKTVTTSSPAVPKLVYFIPPNTVGFLVGDGLHNRMLDFFENEWLDTGLLTS